MQTLDTVLVYYDAHSVATPTERNGEFHVHLGGGERELPRDEAVARLVRKMYKHVSPLAPLLIYHYVKRSTFEHDALGREFTHEHDNGCDLSVPGGDAKDWRFRSAKLSHVATNLLQEYADVEDADELETVGHARQTFRFDDVDRARLAIAVDKRHRKASVDDVLRCLSRALDHGNLRYGVTRECELQYLPMADIMHNNEHPSLGYNNQHPTLGLSAWNDLVEAINNATDRGAVTILRALVDERCLSAPIYVVHHHWQIVHTDYELVHRVIPQCTLLYRQQAICGGVVELLHPCLQKAWPWWVLSTDLAYVRNVARLLLGLSDEEGVLRSDLQEKLDDILRQQRDEHLDKRVKLNASERAIERVVQHWKQSASAEGVYAPFLLDEIDLVLDDDEHMVSGSLECTRTRCFDAKEGNALWDVLSSEFENTYATETIQRVKDNDIYGVYVVRDFSSGTTVGAFAVVLYQCVFRDGESGVALMVDSIAVAGDAKGKGIGRVVFKNFCRLLAAKRSRRYVVFAQCVIDGDGKKYWKNKLDDNGVARALLLQARRFRDGECVPVHLETDCCPRAREYLSSP